MDSRRRMAHSAALGGGVALFDLLDRPLRVDFYIHRLAHPEQEFARVLHSPLNVGHGEVCGRRDHAACDLDLERQFQGMIGAREY